MCANYEKQLVGEQAAAAAHRDTAARLAAAAQLAAEELEGVRSLHDETIRTWHAERSAARATLDELAAGVRDMQHALRQRAAAALAAEQRALHAVTTLTVDRDTLQRALDGLEKDNAYLVGEFCKKAAEMQNEVIDLPDNVEELQELTLRLREQLIVSALGRERALDAAADLRRTLAAQAAELQAHAAEHLAAQAELEQQQTERAQLKELADKLRQANHLSETLLEDKARLTAEAAELRVRVGALQQELDNSEKVQQDFVRLSQSLQVQLQRIRESESEVRWQFEEDVTACPACRAALPSSRKKVHCRHCGRIFCAACTAHEVPCGPRGAPAKVCAVCRTLLQPHAPPYFSTRPPR